jgi:hypothetical protein
MPIRHVVGLFIDPKAEWERIQEKNYSISSCILGHTVVLSLVPAVAGFIGTTQIGWQIGAGAPVRLTTSSAGTIAVLYYFAMIAAVIGVGVVIRWMGQTYGASQPLSKCMVLASLTASPLFLIGIMQLYPVLWLNFVIGLVALGYTVYIFYSGVPIMMQISQERGFLFSSAVLAFGLVTLVAMLAVTILLWGAGLAPAFTQ